MGSPRSLLATVYQDDSDGFVYPPSPANTKAELLATDQVGDAHRLFTTLYADSEGVVQNFTKLRFASRETTATLGVDVAFLPGGELRHEVNWQAGSAGALSTRWQKLRTPLA